MSLGASASFERRRAPKGRARRSPSRAAWPLGFVGALLLNGCRDSYRIGDFLPGQCEAPYVDPAASKLLGPDDRSHWLQPWRAESTTRPAARMRAAATLTLIGLDATQRADRARRGAAAGFARALISRNWVGMSYADPRQLRPEARDDLRSQIALLKEHGLRPVVLLDAFKTFPTPREEFEIQIVEAAAAGSRSIVVDDASAQRLSALVGYAGLDELSTARAAEVIITRIDAGGVAGLSKPLPVALEARPHRVSALRYRPFYRPLQADGTPSPQFEETLQGWLDYVRAVVLEVQDALGSAAFDIELHNELLTNDDFLDINHYYTPPVDRGLGDPADEIPRAIVDRTVAMLRDPATGVGPIGIGDGFANTRWLRAAVDAPVGLTALGRHPHHGGYAFPAASAELVGPALNARGAPNGRRETDGRFREAFTPAYEALFPEVALTPVLDVEMRRPAQIFRDLLGPSLDGRGRWHGRGASPNVPDLDVWITAVSFRPGGLTEGGRLPRDEHFALQAKAALRLLAAYVGTGAGLVSFYAPEGTDVEMFDWDAPDGGPALRAVSRFLAAFEGAAAVPASRALALEAVASCSTAAQFAGGVEPGQPPLLNRDVVAFFPFQLDATRFVAAAYVMTRDLRKALEPAPYRLRLKGLDGRRVEVTVRDPVAPEGAAPLTADVVAAAADGLTIELPLGDSPRLIEITERPPP